MLSGVRLRLPRRHQAGRSALRRAKVLRKEWMRRIRVFRYVLLGLLAATWVLSAVVPDRWKYPLGLVGGALVALYAFARDSAPAAERWVAGAEGERQTEDALRSLGREGWLIRHDLAAGAGNIDHVAIGPPGVFLLDSKNWAGVEVTVDERGVPAVHRRDSPATRWPRDRVPHQLRRAAAEHHDTLRALGTRTGVWVHPVAVIWAAFPARVVEAGGVAYVHGDELVEWLRNRRPVHTRAEIAALGVALDQVPVYAEPS